MACALRRYGVTDSGITTIPGSQRLSCLMMVPPSGSKILPCST
ncbi:MAG: hypothetical protein P8X74_15315 [Reinekea sp.]